MKTTKDPDMQGTIDMLIMEAHHMIWQISQEWGCHHLG